MVVPNYQSLNVRATPVRYLRSGQGAPLLLLRGDDASEGWRGYMDELAKSFDVIAPEHPGFGGAPKPDWLDSVADMANFYLDMIDALKLRGVRLVGHGLGGWIAAEMALRDQGHIDSLTLVDAAGLKCEGDKGIDLFLVTEEQGIRDKFANPAAGEAELAFKLTPESEDVRIANQMVIAQLAWSPRWHDPNLRKWLHRVRAPTLVVWGEKDAIFPVAHAREWARLISGAQVEIIKDAGHMPHVEKPDEFLKPVLAFLNTQRVAA